MIKVPAEKGFKELEKRWQRIHEILRADARRQLKDNKLLTPAERKLLTFLVGQKEFIGNISTWLPTKEARDKLMTLGLIEENLAIGGFRDWLAEEVKKLVQNNDIPTVLKLLSDVDPASVINIEGVFKKNENVFYKHHDTWVIQFQGKRVQIRANKRLYYLANLLDRPNHDFTPLQLAKLVENQAPILSSKYSRRKEVPQFIEDNLIKFLEDQQGADIDRIQYAAFIQENSSLKKELKEFHEKTRSNVAKNIANVKKDIQAKHKKLHRHLDMYIKTGTSCRYIPPEDFEWFVHF